jgi:enamine deaminase RidA (YjgF/YER057c/UK114 family)
MSEIKMKKSTVTILLALLLICAFVFIVWQQTPKEGQVWEIDGIKFYDYQSYYNYYVAKYGAEPTPTPTPTPGREASKIQCSIQNAITSASIITTNTKVDLNKLISGVADFLTKAEQVTVDSAPEQSSLYYGQGQQVIAHVSSDVDPSGGTDYYDDWYVFTLVEGAPVYRLKPSCLTAVQTSPTYKYQVNAAAGENTGETVSYTSGTTPYWDIGVLTVWPRSTAANLDTYLKASGTTLAAITDGTTFVDTDAAITANATMTTTNEDLTVEVRAGAIDIAYGLPMYTLTQVGQFIERRTVLIITTSMTSIGTAEIYDEGWKRLSKPDLTAEVAYYYVLPSIIPLRGDKFVHTVTFPIDASAAASATKFVFKVWMLDMQVPSYVETGSTSTSIPTAYGFIGEYGIDAVIFARALTVTTGAGDNEVLRAYVTTP